MLSKNDLLEIQKIVDQSILKSEESLEERLDKRFEESLERFEERLEERLDKRLEGRLQKFEERWEKRFERLEESLEKRLDRKFSVKFATKEDLSRVTDEIIETIKTFGEITERIDNKVSTLRDEVRVVLTNHEQRLRRLEDKDYN